MSVNLSVPEAVKPVDVPNKDVAEVLREIASQYDTGIPRTAVYELSSEHHVNVLRHTPLGSKQVVEKGDADMVYELWLKWRCDVGSGQDNK